MNKKKLIIIFTIITAIAIVIISLISCKKLPKPIESTATEIEATVVDETSKVEVTTTAEVKPTDTETKPVETTTEVKLTETETQLSESEDATTEKSETPTATSTRKTKQPTTPVKPTKPTTTQPKPTTKQTEPKPTTTAHVHVYDIPIIEIVHHPEEGHSEMRTFCDCGYDITNWTSAQYTAHAKEVKCGGYYNESVYIVDKPAWDEEVIVGYKCACGKVKP